MDKVVFYERGMNEIQGRYDLVKRLIVEGECKVAMSVYHEVAAYLQFMWNIGLIGYEEYLQLYGVHNDNFDVLFGIC